MTAIAWTGAAGDGNFNNPDNWNPKQVPGASDTVTIKPAAAVDIAATTEDIAGLTTNKFVTLTLANNNGFTIGTGATATFSNGGTFDIDSTGNGTGLIVGATSLTLTGGGTVVLSDNINNYISAAAPGDTLDNVNNLIEGAGTIGGGTLTLINAAGGRVDATGGNALVITAATTTNAGLLESTGAGGLVLESQVNGGTTGTISAAGGDVYLHGATLAGGILDSSGGATIIDNGGATLDGSANAVINNGTLTVANNNGMTLLGTITNAGQIQLASGGNGTSLVIDAANVTLNGGGTVALTDNGDNFISAAAAGDTLTNTDNLIEGAGTIGGGSLNFINSASGTVDATGANNALVISTGSGVTTNDGLLEATGAGGLVLRSVVNNVGTISAAGGNVYLQGATITGGMLQSSGGGAIIDNGGATLSGVTINGTVALANNNGMTLLGTITNDGQLQLNAGANAATLVIGPSGKTAGTVTLSGTGQLVLSDNSGNHITGAIKGDKLINKSETISGGGAFLGPLALVNDATIDANAGNALGFGAGVTVSNAKLIESTLAGGGGVVIETTVTNTAAGTILAAAGNVYLSGGTITDGKLVTGTGGIYETSTGTLNGAGKGITNTGSVTAENNTSLSIAGSIINTGTVFLAAAGNGTFLDASGATTTLTGAGTISLSNNGDNFIGAVTAGNVLDNVNNLIEGSGTIGVGGLVLTNAASGVIDGNQGAALVLNTGAAVISNAGLLEATAGGALVIECTVGNAATGIVSANGGTVYLQDGGTIAGGTINTSNGGELIESGGAAFGGTLDGTASAVTNNGTIVAANNTALQLLGSIANAGTIELGSIGNATELYIGPATGAAGTVTLTGAGIVIATDNSNNFFEAGQAGDTLVNDQTIAGAGAFESPLIVVNNGTIDATGGAALIITNGVALTNNAVLEATNAAGAGLVIQTVVNNSNGGTILSAGGVVTLNGGTIEGGTLNSSGGGGYMAVTAGGVLDGSAHAITNLGSINVVNNNALDVLGSIVNQGTLELDSIGNGTDLFIDSVRVTLSGAGTLLLSDNINNLVQSATAGDVLDNVNNIIEGGGQLGAGTLTLINGSAGVIDASGASQLIISTGAAAVQNSGLLESTNSGGLVILNTTIANGAAGKMSANGGNIYLQGATIQGGTLSATGTFSTVVYTGSTLDGSSKAIVNDATVNIDNNEGLTVLGTINNVGTIALNSVGNGTDLIIGPQAAPGTVTLTGKGTVQLSDNFNNIITANTNGGTLINLNNTIEGAGFIGGNGLVLINDATIDATSASNTLQIGLTTPLINNSLIEATGAGGLTVNNTTISDGTKGQLVANGGAITLNGATIEGGTLSGASGFYINSGTVLDGTANTVTNDSTINVDNNNTLFVLGTITNAGTIALNSVGNGTALFIGPSGTAGTVTLTGKGTVLLSNNVNNIIEGSIAGETLVNLNNTIAGAGSIGGNGLVLINDATIDANTGSTLEISTANGVTNNALIEATGAGGLSIVNTTIDNGTTGTISASGGGVTLSGATINGGVLSGASGFTAFNGSELNGTTNTLTNDATVTVANNNGMTLAGTIVNAGAIDIASSGNGTALDFAAGTVTLTGAGTISLTDNTNNYLQGAATTVLDNVNNIIEGAGNLGNGTLALINGGIIAATGANALLLDVGTTGTITASGELLGIGAGGLSIENGTYTNLGIIEAEDGSSVTFQSTAVLTNLAGGTLTGGVYAAVDNGDGATLNLGSSIVADAAIIVLSGANATINGGGNNIERTLQDITTTGTLAVLGNIAYDDTANGGVFNDAGDFIMTGGAFTATSLTIDQGATLSGSGTLASNVVNDGTISEVDGTFMITGKYSGTGTIITNGSGGILELAGGGTLGSGVSGSGTLELALGSYSIGTAAPTIANLVVDAHASLSGTGTLGSTIADAGALTAAGGTLTLDGTVSGSGTLAANAGAELAIAGGGSFAGALSGDGTVLIGSAITLNQGASLSAAEVVDTAQLALGANVALTNNAGSILMLSATGGPGDIEPHRTQIAITGVAGDSITNAGMLMATGSGAESIDIAFTNMGLVDVTGGLLRFGSTISGGGTMSVASGAELQFAGGGSFAGVLNGAGIVLFTGVTTLNAGASIAATKVIEDNNLKLGAGENLTNQAGKTFVLNAATPQGIEPHRTQIELSGVTGDSFTNLGNVVANGGGVEEISVAFVNTGHVTATTGTLSFLGNLSGAGALSASSGAVIDLIGAATLSGAISGAGTVRFDKQITLQQGASIAVANIVETDNLTLGTGESLTNLAANTYTITTGTTAAGDPPHRTQIAVAGATGDIFTNAGTLAVNGTGGATFSLAMVNSGATSVGSGTLSFLGAVTNNGTMTASGATAIFGTTIGGTGTLDVGAGGTMSLLAGAGAGQALDFLTTSGLVDLTTPTSFAGTISGFRTGTTIDLLNTAETSYKFSAGVLTVKNGAAVVASLHFSGAYTTGSFTLGSDTHGGTMITFA